MARRRIPTGEIEGVLRSWHSGTSIRRSSRTFGLSRRTGQTYIGKAQSMGVQRGVSLPPLGPIVRAICKSAPRDDGSAAPQGPLQERLEPHIDWIRFQLEDAGQRAADVWKALLTDRGCDVSLSSFKRFVRTRVLGHRLDLVRARDCYDSLLRAPSPEAVRWIARLLERAGRAPGRQQKPAIGAMTAAEVNRRAQLAWMKKASSGKISAGELREVLGDEAVADRAFANLKRGDRRARNVSLSILGSCRGLPTLSIASFLNISRSTVRLYVEHYKKDGFEAAHCRKTRKRPRVDDEGLHQAVFEILHAPPAQFGFNRASWKMADLKAALTATGNSASKHTIRKIIRASGFRWRKARKVLTSKDPHYSAKLEHIQKILAGLGERDGFFFVDEFGPFAVKMQGGRRLVPPGTVYTVPQFQKSKGCLILTAALDLKRNLVTHFFSERKDTDEMIRMVGMLVESRADLAKIYISWDAASWHISKKLTAFVKTVNGRKTIGDSPEVVLAPLPAGAQFLNVIESVFSGMARAIIHNSDYASVDAAKEAIERYFADRNSYFTVHPKRAGDKIWRLERVKCTFSAANNAKDPLYER